MHAHDSLPELPIEVATIVQRPAATVFSDRAARLRALAEQHSLADFLLFMATLADQQHIILGTLLTQATPPSGQLRAIITQLGHALQGSLTVDNQQAVQQLLALPDEELNQLADTIHQGNLPDAPHLLAALPLVGVGLQLILTAEALRLTSMPSGHYETVYCPVCHGPAVASVLRRGDSGHASRSLSCGFCHSEWHVSRVKCTSCGNTRGLHYDSLVDADAPAPEPNSKFPHQHRHAQEAECCDACHGALKQVSFMQDNKVDAIADDLASLPLDIKLGEAGYHRLGFNPLFFAG